MCGEMGEVECLEKGCWADGDFCLIKRRVGIGVGVHGVCLGVDD